MPIWPGASPSMAKQAKAGGSIRNANETQPCDGTSVDQIVSAQPGLIPQMAGFLTSNRIWGTTNFCDHTSDFVYVHLMRNFTLEETLLAKRAYEKVLRQAGRTAKHYHAELTTVVSQTKDFTRILMTKVKRSPSVVWVRIIRMASSRTEINN